MHNDVTKYLPPVAESSCSVLTLCAFHAQFPGYTSDNLAESKKATIFERDKAESLSVVF